MNLTNATQPAVVHSTFVIERRYPVAPDRVFAALSDPARKRRWFAEGHDAHTFEMDFRVVGAEKASYVMGPQTPFPGTSLTSDATYLDIVPGRRVVIASTMALGGHTMSATLATFELLPTESGTELIFTHQGAFFENSDGPQRREAGWQKLLSRLDGELAR